MDILVLSLDGTYTKTCFDDFIRGLRKMVRILYHGMELPSNDYAALNMFEYGGSDRQEDDEYRWRQGYVFYNKILGKTHCLCGRHISNLYYIVPKWDKIIHDKLAVGSTCIKRFQVKNLCRNCNHEFIVHYDHCADLCPSCQTCRLCCKKKSTIKNLCSKCWKNIFVPNLEEINHKKIKQSQKQILVFNNNRKTERVALATAVIRRWCRHWIIPYIENKRLLLFQRKRSIRIVKRYLLSIVKEKRHKANLLQFIKTRRQRVITKCIVRFAEKLRKKRQLTYSRQKRQDDRIKKLKNITENISKWDKKQYPRRSQQMVKLWDLSYEEVYRTDRENPHHPMAFQEYASVKYLLSQ